MSGQEGPETVSYWAKILVEQGVQVAMSTLGELPEYNVSVAEAAMQAAYEGKSKDFANYIDARWHEQIDLTKLENDSSWIKRETLLFLRGGDEFWLSLLFSNNGHATHYPLNACLEEIEYNLRAGQDIPFERVDRFLDIAIKHGMRANEIKEQGMELPFSLACGILAQLHGHPPENVARWKKVIERIDQRNNQTDYFDQIEGELKVLLSNTPINTLAIQKVAETVSQIPYKDRRLSPYYYVVDQAENRALYPAVQFMSALSAGGLDVSHYEPDGITPLHATLRSERLNASDLREIAGFLTSKGASADVFEISTSSAHPLLNATHLLHNAVYASEVPWDLLTPSLSFFNQQDAQGMTAMLYASRELRLDIIDALLDLGANPHITNPDQNTILHELFEYAILGFADIEVDMNDLAEMANRLKHMGVKLDARNNEGLSPLASACNSVSSQDRASEFVSLLKALDEVGWEFPCADMEAALRPMPETRPVRNFLSEKMANLDASALQINTPMLNSPSRRRAL